MNNLKEIIKKSIPFELGKKLRGSYQKYLAFKYRGDNYYCPYCRNSFEKMLPDGFDLEVNKKYNIIGSGYRDNCTCPRCYSKDRDRLIYLYLESQTNVLTDANKILHIAPETWMKELFLRNKKIDYTYGVKGAKQMGYYYDRFTKELDITKLNMANELYDIVICNHVLEHIPNDQDAINEIYRVLKPGGWAILQVPISSTLETTYEDPTIKSEKDRAQHFGQFDHVRIYGKDYFKRLEMAGFKASRLNPVKDKWEIKDLAKYAINPQEDLFIAHKNNN